VRKLERTALLEASVERAYAVVVDVLRYPEFVPGCETVEVLETTETGLVARVAVAGRGLRESFVTENRHEPCESVLMSLQQGPFERLQGQWRFTALGDVGCRVDLRIEYVPKGILARLLSPIADKVANRLVDAFSERITSQPLLESPAPHAN